MAQNLQQLKRRIKTSKNIAQIAKALEMIAASKIKRAQGTSQNNRPYAEKITTLTSRIAGTVNMKNFTHPYLTTQDNPKKLLIVISPDRGLCGSLNTNIYKKMIEAEDSNTRLVTIGKKAGHFATKLKFDLIASFPMGSSLPDLTTVYALKQIIDEELTTGNSGNVNILYADFISLFTQEATTKQLLPLKIEAVEQDITLDSSLFEPNSATLLQDLLPYYLEVQLYNALLQAFTSEQAAQMVAMQNAKNNAFDIAQYFTLVYNKSRQERITNEILDLANSKQV